MISLEDIIRRHRAVEIKIVENSVDLPGAAEIIVANPEVERQRGCDLPVVRQEETVVVESVSPDCFTVVEGETGRHRPADPLDHRHPRFQPYRHQRVSGGFLPQPERHEGQGALYQRRVRH